MSIVLYLALASACLAGTVETAAGAAAQSNASSPSATPEQTLHTRMLQRLESHSKWRGNVPLRVLLPEPTSTTSMIVVLRTNGPGRERVARLLQAGHSDIGRRHFHAAVELTFSVVINGFSARLSGEAVSSLMAQDEVAFVEDNGVVLAASDEFELDDGLDNDGVVDGLPIDPSLYNLSAGFDISATVPRISGNGSIAGAVYGESITVVSPAPSWGLDRIDQVTLPLDNMYSFSYDGTGVDGMYLIETCLMGTSRCTTDRVCWTLWLLQSTTSIPALCSAIVSLST